MKLLLVIFATTLIACSALSIDGRRASHSLRVQPFAGIDLASFFERFKDILKNGNSTLGIPVLDPYDSEEENISFKEDTISMDAHLTNVHIDGISEYEVQKASLSIIGVKIDVGLKWPAISLDTLYSLNGNIGDSFPIYGLGTLKAVLKGLDFDGTVSMSIRDGHVYVKEVVSKLKLDALEINATGLFNDDELSEMLSAIISDMAPQLVEDFQPEVTKIVNTVISDVLNDVLKDKTLKDLLDLLK